MAEPLYRQLARLRKAGVRFELIGNDLHVYSRGGRLSEATYRWLVEREHAVKALVRYDEGARALGLDPVRIGFAAWLREHGRLREG